jgi:Ni2+-binding GTPase involved in maturation of urease and hydrogenase
MPKFKLAPVVMFALVVAHDLKTQIDARQAAKLYLAAAESYEETQRCHEAQIKYLCEMLDRNEIDVTEFDLMVLNYHQS